MIDALKSFF